MPKTPDDIKKGLECCLGDTHAYHCDECPYADDESEVDDGCGDNGIQLLEDALALIQQLQAENAEQAARIQQVEAERDAALETIYEMAECITEDVCEWCDGVECERLCMQHTILRPGFKWRGVQKEG